MSYFGKRNRQNKKLTIRTSQSYAVDDQACMGGGSTLLANAGT